MKGKKIMLEPKPKDPGEGDGAKGGGDAAKPMEKDQSGKGGESKGDTE
jgi:hypothetical protein